MCPVTEPRRDSSGTSRASIELSQQARNHCLFPMLDYLIKTSHQVNQSVARIEGTLEQLKVSVNTLQSAHEELKQLIEKTSKQSFSLKNEGYQVNLWCTIPYTMKKIYYIL